MITRLKVLYGGREIGMLIWDKRRGTSYFNFNPALDIDPSLLSPLTIPSDASRRRIPVWGAEDAIYNRLPPFLADSLPDRWGNLLFEQWCREQRIPISSVTPLDKLSFIGRRAMGAFEFEPVASDPGPRGKIDMSALVSLARKVFAQRQDVHILPEESLTMQALIALGSSPGGRQPKALVAIDRATGEIRSGQIAGLEGHRYGLLKFGDAEYSSAELEMTYHDLAVDAGLAMTAAELLEFDGSRHFLTERFDRADGRRVHVQTLAAMAPGVDSYEGLMDVCRRLGLGVDALTEVFRRMVFNILSNNTDDHNKNFSFLIGADGRWSLSPAYDMTFIFDTNGMRPMNVRCMSVGGKLADITMDDVLTLAVDNDISRARGLTEIQRIARSLGRFGEVASCHGVNDACAGIVGSAINDNLRAWGLADERVRGQYVVDGHSVGDIRIEVSYKGNYHILFTRDGRPSKLVVDRKSESGRAISMAGAADADESLLLEIIRRKMS